jgi:phosphoglycerate-specific signal transduction histidine kinase
VQLIQKIENVEIRTNKIIFKQILLSLLARVLYFSSENNSVSIIAHRADNKDSIKIQIIDNGTIFNEVLFQDFLYKKQNYLFAGLINILLRLETIESIVREFKGDLRIESNPKGNCITLLLPIAYNSNDKIIHINKIAYEDR